MLTSFVLSLFACTGSEATSQWSENIELPGDQDTDVGGFDPAATVSVSAFEPASPYDNEWYLWDVTDGLTVSWTANGLTVTEGGDVDVTGEGRFAVFFNASDEESAEPLTITTETSYKIDASLLAHGDYYLVVAIVDNTGDLVQVYDVESVAIREPSVELPRLGDGLSVDSTTELTIDTSGFSFDADAMGGANEFTKGHYVVRLDGETVGEGADDVFLWPTALEAGPHEIEVEVVENDGSSFTTPFTVGASVFVPTVTATDLTEGATWGSASVPVLAEASDVTIDIDSAGEDHVPGTGHFHLYVDDVYQTAFGADGGYGLHVAAGMHTFEARLANNDHTEVGVGTTWTATVADDRRDIILTLPTDPITQGGDAVLTISAENFVFDPENVGGAAVEGYGHYHVYVDGVYSNFGATGDYTLSGLLEGDHVVSVVLAGNDHVELTPMVFDQQTLTIEPAQVEDTGDTGDTGGGQDTAADTGA